MNNWKTSLVGMVLGVATYLVGIGGKLPSNRNEATFFVASLAIAALGVTAKDFNVVGGTKQATTTEGLPQKPDDSK